MLDFTRVQVIKEAWATFLKLQKVCMNAHTLCAHTRKEQKHVLDTTLEMDANFIGLTFLTATFQKNQHSVVWVFFYCGWGDFCVLEM